MDIIETRGLAVLKENMFGELEWKEVNEVNLGSCKKPNKSIKEIKFYPKIQFRL